MRRVRLKSINIGQTVTYRNTFVTNKLKLLEKRSDGICILGVLEPRDWDGGTAIPGIFNYTNTNWRGKISILDTEDWVTLVE